MHRILILTFTFCALFCQLSAQDVITLTNAEEISAKVEEITESEIIYKKASNPKGPSYRVSRGKVLSIKYANGEKDVFTTIDSQKTTSSVTSQEQRSGKSDDLEANSDAFKKISQMNDIHYVGKSDNNKKAKKIIGFFYPTDDSEIADANVELSFYMVTVSRTDHKPCVRGDKSNLDKLAKSFISNNFYAIRVTNRTDKIIYLDKGNCFFIHNSISVPYYVPQKTSEYEGSSTGLGVDLGSFSGGLLGGVSLGNSTSSGTTTTTYSQRIVSIPPHMSIDLQPMPLIPIIKIGDDAHTYFGLELSASSWDGHTKIEYKTMDEVSEGEERILPPMSEYAFGSFITYAFDEQMTISYNLNMTFLMKKVIGYKKAEKDLTNGYLKSLSIILE